MADADLSKNFLDVKVNPANANLDIVAVHGLNPFSSGSNAYSTWTAEDKKVQRCWLTDADIEGFLPKTLPGARVMIFSYNSNAVFGSSSATVNQHATNLLTFLRQKRRNLNPPGRPLIFICHSLGGLLVKRAIVMAYTTDLYRDLYNATKGFVFFGTPQGGSAQAGGVGNIAATIARTVLHRANQHYLDTLSLNSLCAETNRLDFLQRTKDFAFISVIESKKTKGVEVVSKADSVLGLPMDKERRITLDADHNDVCRFWNPNGRPFEHVREEIVEMAENAVQTHEAPADVPANDGSTFRIPFSLHGVPALNNFVERLEITAELEHCLLPRQPQPSQNQRRKIFVLHGLGGIGKTQLAVDFARRHQNTFSSIFWLDGRSEDRLKQSIASSASRIPQGQIPERSRRLDKDEDPNETPREDDPDATVTDEDLDATVKDVMGWLAKPNNTDWLLVFDNVDQDFEQGGRTGAYDLNRYLPSDHGSILVTTRLLRLSQMGDSKRLTKVDEELAKAIFQKWYKKELDADGEKLLTLLDGLPLALAQAASYLYETDLDLASYAELYKKQWDDLVESEDDDGPSLPDYEERSIGTTWAISFKEVEARSSNAADLLRLWAFLDNKQLWHGLIEVASNSDEVRAHSPKWLQDIARNKFKFMNAIRLLLRYSLIEAHGTLKNSYGMHPVVHRWTAHIQDERQKRYFLELAILVVGFSVSAETTKEYWTVHRRLLPHAERCSWWMLNGGQPLGSDKWSSGSRLVINGTHWLGILFYRQGNLKEAENMWLLALEGKTKLLGASDISTLRTVNNLGNVYTDQDRLEEAEKMYLRALEGKEKAVNKDDMSILDTVNNLGNLYTDQGRLAAAEGMYLRALQGKEKVLDSESVSVLQTVNSLGILYFRQDKLEQAEEMFTRALKGREKVLSPTHIATLETVNNFGSLYIEQSKLEEAERMYLRALQGKEDVLGRENVSTLQTAHNLGNLYYRQGKLGEAEEMYLRALEGLENAIGGNHTLTLRTVHSLGTLYYQLDKLKDAEKMYRRALLGKEKKLGKLHSSTLQTTHDLSILLWQDGRPEEANDTYSRALEGRETTQSTLNIFGKLIVMTEKASAEYDLLGAEVAKTQDQNPRGTVVIPPKDTALPVASATQALLDNPAKKRIRIVEANMSRDHAFQFNAPVADGKFLGKLL